MDRKYYKTNIIYFLDNQINNYYYILVTTDRWLKRKNNVPKIIYRNLRLPFFYGVCNMQYLINTVGITK